MPIVETCSLAGDRSPGLALLDAHNAQLFIAPSPFARETAALAAPPPVGSRQLAPREKLFAQGDAAEQVFDVVEGSAMILRELSRGQRQIVDIAGPGRVVGFCVGERHDCTAVTLTSCVVRARARQPGAEDVYMLAEIQRLRDLAALLGRKTAMERLATFLMEMIGDDFDFDKPLDFPVCRQEIADYLGLVIETVSRNFVALRRRGVIEPASRESVYILDSCALSLIAAGLARD